MNHRKLILSLLVALCLAFSASAFAAAGAKKAQKTGGRPPQLERLHQVLEKMNLDGDQVALITPILDKADEQFGALRAQSKAKGNRAGARGNVQALMRQTIAQIEQHLTAPQRSTLRDEMKPGKRNQSATTQPAK